MTLTAGTEFTFGSLGFQQLGVSPRVTSLSDGRVAVSWHEALVFPFNGITDVDGAIFTRVFNADGTPATAATQVNTVTEGSQIQPEIAPLSDGGYVVTWTSSAPLGAGHNDTDIHARIYNADGTPRGGEIVVSVDDPMPGSTSDDNVQGFVQGLAGGGFAVVWPVGNSGGVRGRVFDSAGTEVTAETQLFDDALFLSDMIQLSNGNLVLVNDMSGTFRISGPDLTSTVTTVAVPPFATGAIQPRLTAMADGGFAMLYRVIDGGASHLRLEVFDASGTLQQGTDVPVTHDLTINRFEYDLLGLSNNTVAIVTSEPGFSENDVFLQTYGADGTQINAPLRINTNSTLDQGDPRLTEMPDGQVVVSFVDGSFFPLTDGGVQDFSHGRFVTVSGNTGGGGDPTPVPVATTGDDSLTGTAGSDTIDGLAGNDTINGLDGTDQLIGGDGNDVLIGGATAADLRDVLYGGDGNDSLDGGYGNDELRGDAGNDSITGGFGVDEIFGGADNDVLTGQAWSDLIFGGDGMDFINGGFGFDRVNGGNGADQFFHIGNEGHGSDWIQDYTAADGDVLMYGGSATRDQFQVNFTETANAGQAGVEEAFVIYRPTGQILWALVDGQAQAEINLLLNGQTFDLLS